MFREPSSSEREIINRLREARFPGRDELAKQLGNCLVRIIDEDGSLEFDIRADVKAPVSHRIPVEAMAQDVDGVMIHVLLHVVGGKAKELEVYKDDSSCPIKMPPASEFQLLVLPPPKPLSGAT